MRKLLMIVGTIALAAGFASCVKKRECECTYKDNGVTKTEIVPITSTGGVTKMACEMMSASYDEGSCKLK